MANSDFLYKNNRPRLTIEFIGFAQLANCYSASYYRVISSPRRLTKEQIYALRDAHLLGTGQEFMIKSECNGKENPVGEDEVQCVEFINGVAQPGPVINPWTQKPFNPIQEPYYQYDTECRCDSGD